MDSQRQNTEAVKQPNVQNREDGLDELVPQPVKRKQMSISDSSGVIYNSEENNSLRIFKDPREPMLGLILIQAIGEDADQLFLEVGGDEPKLSIRCDNAEYDLVAPQSSTSHVIGLELERRVGISAESTREAGTDEQMEGRVGTLEVELDRWTRDENGTQQELNRTHACLHLRRSSPREGVTLYTVDIERVNKNAEAPAS